MAVMCSMCGVAAPPAAAFCPKCGSKLPSACPACGAPCSPDFAFCPRCGKALASAAPPSVQPVRVEPPAPTATPAPSETDRRTVTVLFADLSGFTALSEQLDPEEVRAFQSELFSELSTTIERYGGFVEKYVGDAAMAVFGAPTAHEDDPERALRAALDMQAGMGRLNERWARRLGRSLALHVGINTGPVVAGAIGTTSDAAYAVTGDTVNTAARLQGAAQPGQVLVSRASHALTRHAFTFEALGELSLKGKAEGVSAFRLLGALEAPRPARGLEALGLHAPLIGRERELGQLLAAFDVMRAGRTQVVSLVGEAGVGKSRLLGEFVRALEEAGRLADTAVRRAACSSLGEQTYGVVAALLRQAYGVAPDDSLDMARRKLATGLEALGADLEEQARFAALLGHVLGLETEDPSLRHLEPEQIKRQLFLVTRALVERRLEGGPLLLMVEDLHWADAASVELLRFVTDRLTDRRLMIVATYRPVVEPGSLAGSRVSHTVIRLERLSDGESQAWLGALLGPAGEALPERLRALIVGRAGGNPLYLEEILRSLLAQGTVVRENSGWRWTAGAPSVDVPVTLQGLLLSRLDRLSPDARRTLQEAAVLGSAFDERLLRRAGAQPAALDDVLERLQDAELLTEEPRAAGIADRRFRFTHGLVQEVVYENLLHRRRTELHTRVGQALESLYGQAPSRLEDLEALGHHWSLSADKPRGARYLVAAGDWARAIYASADATRQYQRALETLSECEGCEGERLAVNERMGDLLVPAGGREEALRYFERALRGHEATGDRRARARLHRKIGGLHWEGGDRARAQVCFAAGLAELEEHRDDVELAHLYQEMGRLAFRDGDHQRALEWAERALAHVEPLLAPATEPQDPETRREAAAALAHAHNTLGVALARLGRLEEAVARIERSVVAAEAEGLLSVVCRGYANLGVLYSTLDPARSIETCQRGLTVAKRIGDLGFQSRLYANLAVAYCALTNQCDVEGIAAAQSAIDLDRRLGLLDHLAVPLIVLGQIYQCHGEHAQAFAMYEEALGLAEQVGEPQLLFPCYDGLATLHLDAGNQALAEAYLAKAQQVCERAGVEPDALMVLPFLC
jgi:adenylate cyclase